MANIVKRTQPLSKKVILSGNIFLPHLFVLAFPILSFFCSFCLFLSISPFLKLQHTKQILPTKPNDVCCRSHTLSRSPKHRRTPGTSPCWALARSRGRRQWAAALKSGCAVAPENLALLRGGPDPAADPLYRRYLRLAGHWWEQKRSKLETRRPLGGAQKQGNLRQRI